MGRRLDAVTVLRVSVRPDLSDESVFDAIDVAMPEDAPSRTPDGRPWVRWAKYGSYTGWYSAGSRAPSLGGSRPSFWQAVFSVACACAGGNIDQAHSCGRGILALGGLGVTLRSGYAQLLLHSCLLSNPARFVEVMAPVLHATGAFTKASEKSPSGVALVDSKGHLLLTEEKMRQVVMLGSDSSRWTEPQKDRAKLWVSCCSALLRDERMDAAQLAFAEEVMPALLTESTKTALRWPKKGMGDRWQYTNEQQMLWGLALVLALEDEQETERLMVGAAGSQEIYDAEAILRQVRLDVAMDNTYEGIFQTRCVSALSALGKLLQVGLGEGSG
jgi:hypothetical protein